MKMILAIIVGILGFFLIEKYKRYVGGWTNAYLIWVFLVFTIFILYSLSTGDLSIHVITK